MVCPPGYLAIRCDRSQYKGGGVLLIYKQHLKVIDIDVPLPTVKTIPSDEDDVDKFELVCVDLLDGSLKFRLCCFYVPPKSSQKLSITKFLCGVMNKLISKSMPTFIFGDFNYPKIDWSVPVAPTSDKAHTALLEFVIENNLFQCIDEPTHVRGNVLDLLLCNYSAKKSLLSSFVLPPLSATCDHNVLAFTFNCSNHSNDSSYQYPDFSKANFPCINTELITLNYANIFNTDSTLQSQYDGFLACLKTAIAHHVPVKIVKNSKSNRRPKHLRQLLKNKLHLYRKLKSDSTYKLSYNKASKDYDKAVSHWYDKIESDMCSNANSRKFFNYVNKKLKVKSSIPPLFENNNSVTSDIGKANLLNSCFQKFFTKDDSRLPSTPIRDTANMPPFLITIEDIKSAVSNAKDKISRTPEGVPTFFIKRIINSILIPLAHLFNSFLQSGFVPSQWKVAFVVPIFKKGNKSDPGNYRPVSLTSSFCRIFEAIIFDKMLNHLLSNNLLSPSQFGFLPNRSSCSQLLHCLNKWYQNFFNNCVTNVIYTDIAKAFDTVSHRKLVKVLASYKICPSVILWIEHFLTNRSQQVVINETLSQPLRVHSGVPQGSVVGPLLFVMFFNDITTCASSLYDGGGISLFADDAKLFSCSTTKLQESLNKLHDWTEDFQLRLAPSKCYHLQIKKRSVNCDLSPLFLNGTEIQPTNHFKDLGIIISHDLEWSSHVNAVYSKASARSFHILKSFKSKNIWTLIKLFKTYVRPHLEYNTPIWSPNLKSDIDKIERVQRNFTKRVCLRCNIPFSSYAERLQKLNMFSLQCRRIKFDLIQVYKLVYEISDLNFSDFFVPRISQYSIRGNTLKIDNIRNQKHKSSSLWLNSFFGRAVKYWNLLPNDIAVSTSLPVFKKKLQNFDLSFMIDKK